MSHFCFFRLEICTVILLRRYLDRNSSFDLESEVRKSVHLVGVIGEQAQRFAAEISEYLRTDPIFPEIGGKVELNVGLDRIVTFFLKRICFDLVYSDSFQEISIRRI